MNRPAMFGDASRWLVLAMALLASWPDAALAQSTTNGCIDDHKRVQTERQTGHYLEARDAAQHCASAACPQLVREDCAAWYVDIERSIPTLLFEVSDTQRRDLVDVQVLENGQPLTGAVAGRSVELDPGPHHLRFEAKGHRPHELDLVVREGSKNRKVSVTLRPLESRVRKSVADSGQRLSPAVLTLGAVATAALTTYAALGIHGRVTLKRLDDRQCKPGCNRADVAYVNRMYTAANIAAGVGVAAAITATVLYFASRRESARPAKLSWAASGDDRGGTLSLRAKF